ncbi:MAG: hypothetical protein ABH804_01725 [archaeon]
MKLCFVCKSTYHYALSLCEKHWKESYKYRRKESGIKEPFAKGDFVIYRQKQPGTDEGIVIDSSRCNYWVKVQLLLSEKKRIIPVTELEKIDSLFEEASTPGFLQKR